jgi:hypothetical protein
VLVFSRNLTLVSIRPDSSFASPGFAGQYKEIYLPAITDSRFVSRNIVSGIKKAHEIPRVSNDAKLE